MTEWILGITPTHPTRWKAMEPLWSDEQLTISSSHTFFNLMSKLCGTAIKSRREYDFGINEHLWNLKVLSLKEACISDQLRREKKMKRCYAGDDSQSSDEDENSRKQIVIESEGHGEMHQESDLDDGDVVRLPSSTKLSEDFLPSGSVIQVTYDYGSTTRLYLKVLSVNRGETKSLINYFALEEDKEKYLKDLQKVPAYTLPKDKQVDQYFPNASRVFLGYYIPIYKQTNSDSEEDYQPRELNKCVMGSMTIGLCSRIRSDDDTTFCSIENRTCTSDVLFCPNVLDPNELLEAVDNAWESRDSKQDPDNLHMYRCDCIKRWIVSADNDEEYESIKQHIEGASEYGPKHLLFRLAKDRKKSGFDFEKVFPKTYAMLKSGKFRWINYKKGVLRVLVGRGVGSDHRQFGVEQVLKTWKYDFQSFHDLLCAVEASWAWKGKELTADTVIPEFDLDLGPSNPLPKEPTCYGSEKDSVLVYKCNDIKKLVTAMAITEDPDGTTVLYSGHDDGTLIKWSLAENKMIWSKQIYVDGTEDFSDRDSIFYVKATGGVSGIAIRPHPKKVKHHIIYTWSDAYTGYPDVEFDNRDSAVLIARSGEDGSIIRRYCCNVGYDEEGDMAFPSIATVVFCKLYIKNKRSYVDSIVVGLHCLCNVLDYDESYSDFDLAEAEQLSEGNILPFREHDGVAMKTWRGHSGLISAMAVVNDKYLLSHSIQRGHGYPDAFILWSLMNPGVPVCRWDCWNPKRSLFKQMHTRLHEIVGVCADGIEVFIADNTADRVAVMTLEDEFGDPSIKIRGYGNIGNKYSEDHGFHGRMATCGPYAIMANEVDPTVWIFKIKGCMTYEKLDRRDGNPDKYDRDEMPCDDDEGARQQRRAGRSIAVGKIIFPLWGGNEPTRKKQKFELPYTFSISTDDDKFGEGGPITLSIRGKWIVAGFSNGSIASIQLPNTFEQNSDASVCANTLACTSHLPSDEWNAPFLECEDD